MTVIKYAPIILFVYNRVYHTKETIKSILGNKESIHTDLYVYADGAKRIEDEESVEQVRSLFQGLKGFKSVTLIQREKNLGLAQNIITGVTEVIAQHDRVIVLEDDLVLSPYFLKFMNENLERYQENHAVGSIHGYLIPTKIKLPEAFFLRGSDCWGWATWKRAWDLFEKDGQKLLTQLKDLKLEHDFDMGGVAGNLDMLKAQVLGKNNSWAIRWHASLFIANKLTLNPGRSLVNNIGTDNSGEHCITTDVYSTAVAAQPIVFSESIPVTECSLAIRAYQDFYRKLNPPIFMRLLRKTKRIFDSILQ